MEFCSVQYNLLSHALRLRIYESENVRFVYFFLLKGMHARFGIIWYYATRHSPKIVYF